MDIFFALGVSSALLVATALRGGWLMVPLGFSLVLFFGLHWRRGKAPADLARLVWAGAQQSFGVLSILLLIGGLMAAWMASGTVATLVYYGLQLIQPRLFILSAFSLTAVVSMLIGTSFGAVGTVGLALMIMARSGAVSLPWAAGAIIAGAYVGDRCSPLSSSAYLVATVTHTDIYANLKAMMATSRVPLLVSIGVYLGASWWYPLRIVDQGLRVAMPEAFNLHWVTLLPAATIFLLVALRVPVKLTLLISLALALGLAVGLQGYGPLALVRFLVLGFHLAPPTPLADIFQGGGLWPMAKVCWVVVISTALAGLLAGTQTLALLQLWVAVLPQGGGLFLGTIGVSLVTAAYGCTQTMAIVLTQQLTLPTYQRANLPPSSRPLI
ncbi:MAG: Na+/H+ antiporter NhaC family protein [Nodosilinea sp.]